MDNYSDIISTFNLAGVRGACPISNMSQEDKKVAFVQPQLQTNLEKLSSNLNRVVTWPSVYPVRSGLVVFFTLDI